MYPQEPKGQYGAAQAGGRSALERWSAGALERWSAGALERWSAGALERWSASCCYLLGGGRWKILDRWDRDDVSSDPRSFGGGV
jgi:hypothetical protein